MTRNREFVGIALPRSVIRRVDAVLNRDDTYNSRGEIAKIALLEWLDRQAGRESALPLEARKATT